MTPPKRDDDTGTEAPEAPAEVAIDTESLLHDHEVMQKLLLAQEDRMQEMADRMAAMEAAAASQAAPNPDVPDPEDFVQEAIPEGHRRYASRYTEATLIKTAGDNLFLNGKVVNLKADAVEFSGGVFSTWLDYHGPTPIPELIEWLESHPDFNQTFWVDDYAVKRHSAVEVTQGVKSVTNSPRAPLVAPMQ